MSYLIKVLKRFSVACHYKVYIVYLLLCTLCSKADMCEYTCERVCEGVLYVRVAFVAYNLRVHYGFSSRVC